MKSMKLALAIVLLCGTLSACKQEAPTPAEDVTSPAATEPAPVMPEPMDPDATMLPPTETMPADDAEEDDTPHSGGDRVGTGTGGAPAPDH